MQVPFYYQEAGRSDWLHGPFAAGNDRMLAEDLARRDYFTRQTGRVLHQRAKWLVLRSVASGAPLAGRRGRRVEFTTPESTFKFNVCTGPDRFVQTLMRPPSLVLFEGVNKHPAGHHQEVRRPRSFFARQRKVEERPASDQHEPGLLDIGFLIIELFFAEEQQVRFDDLLLLNELFRYWIRPYVAHSSSGEHAYQAVLSDLPIDLASPERTIGQYVGPEEELEIYLNRWTSILKCPIRAGNDRVHQVIRLSPEQNKNWVLGDAALPNAPDWLIHADNRSYVWTCAVFPPADPHGEGLDLSRKIRDLATSFGGTPAGRAGRYPGQWIKLLNIDLPPSRAEKPSAMRELPTRGGNDVATDITAFEEDWARERTYLRWAHRSTLYGFTYHSGAMLSAPCAAPPTWRHFASLYFDQALLLLYVRTALFQMSFELSDISGAARDEPGRSQPAHEDSDVIERLRKDFTRLRWQFAHFTNLYQFPLISNQQQAIEMYSLCRDRMDVKQLFEDVKEEIESTHEFLHLQQDKEISHKIMLLTVVTLVALSVSLLLGYFSAAHLVEHPVTWRFWEVPLGTAIGRLAAIGCVAVAILSLFAFAFRAQRTIMDAFTKPLKFWFRRASSRNRNEFP